MLPMRKTTLFMLVGAAALLLPTCARADDSVDFCKMMVSVVWSFNKGNQTVPADLCKTQTKNTELCNYIITNQEKIFQERTQDCNEECICREILQMNRAISGDASDEDSSHSGFFSSLKGLFIWFFQGDTPVHVTVSTIDAILSAIFPRSHLAIKLAQPFIYRFAQSMKSVKPEAVEQTIDDAVNWIRKTFTWLKSSYGMELINSFGKETHEMEKTKSVSYEINGNLHHDNVVRLENTQSADHQTNVTEHK